MALERFLRWHVMDRGGPDAGGHRARLRRHPGGRRRTRYASAAPWTASSSDAERPRVRRRLQDRQARTHQAPRSPATRSSPSTSSPCARARSTRLFDGAPPRAGRRRTRPAAPGRRQEGGRRDAAQGQAQEPLEGRGGVGRRSARHRRGPGPRRTLHADRRAALHALRVPASCSARPEGRHIVE